MKKRRLIFVAPAPANHAPEATTRAPLRRPGIRETLAQLRRSSALKDLLAECALWTAPWTAYPPYQDRDCAEEFALCAAVWSGLPFYDGPGGAQALPSATPSPATTLDKKEERCSTSAGSRSSRR